MNNVILSYMPTSKCSEFTVASPNDYLNNLANVGYSNPS